LNKTNEIIDLVREDIVTANSSVGNTAGNARIIGSLSTNTIYVEAISGGDLESVDDLVIISNTLFSNSSINVDGNITVGANLIYIVKTSNLNDLVPATSYALGNTTNRWRCFFSNTISTNLTVSGNTILTGNTTANNLTVTGTANFEAGFEFSGDLTIDNITVTGTANIAALEVGGLVANGVAMVGTSAAVATNAITTIDSFDKTVSRGLKYIIQGNNADAASAYTVEIMCAHNNTTAYYTRYAEVKNNFDVTIEPIVSGADVLLRVTCPSASVSNTHFFNIMRLETR
jgi:acyl-homoserine lactone acylase PvdQ